MLISAPPSLHYPITITALLKQPGDDVERRAPLFSYTYTSSTVEGNRFGEERNVRKTYPAEFESEAEGRVVRWHIAVSDIVASAGTPLIEIDEPCKHEIQFAGLCVNCGKDMTEVDYATTQPNAHRATISMVHGHTALKVSQDEANRSSDASMRRLLATKKLSLVVDLDQTIIHAVCDPTVADWQKDESNPNHAAVKDVESFELMDEGPSNRPCSYYIKMRQGLKGFLERMSSKFELHIYTMGTRSYAHHVANIVDPEHKIFADRILSRDESGSMTAKNLHRLFPVDTKMVVIIDDRGDIWGWSPNLIRVQPFSFFVGIGDINSSFLPPQQDVIAPKSAPEMKEAKNEPVAEPKDAKSIEDALLQMAGDNDPSKIEEQGNKQQEEIAAQVQDRPLLREQELLDKQDEDGDKTNGSAAATPDAHRRHPLLQDDDRELEFLEDHLKSVHDAFFTEYERKLAGAVGGRVAELRPDKRAAKKARPVDDLLLVPDVKEIMPRMKSDVLAGVVVCFTGVIPQNIDPQFSDLGFWARTFGAVVSTPLNRSVTHVVADPQRRTTKLRQAARMVAQAAAAGQGAKGVQIVDKGWLYASVSKWQRAPEGPFRIVVDDEPLDAPIADVGDGDKPARPAGLVIKVEALDELEDKEMLDGLTSPIEEIVADIGGETGEKWDDWDAELEEFLLEEDTASEHDSAPATPPGIVVTEPEGEEDAAAAGRNKRKREPADVEGETPPDSAAAAAPSAPPPAPESELQRRKKRAFERTSSLTQVANAAGPADDGVGAGEEAGGKKKVPNGKGVRDDDEGGDGYDAAAMEAEMLAAFEMDGEDDVKGDG